MRRNQGEGTNFVLGTWVAPLAHQEPAKKASGLLGGVKKSVASRYTKMKTATNIYIFNLALADALATSTLPFQSTKYLMETWPFGELLCKVVLSIDYYNMFTSIFTLTMMSVDRYVAVCHPVRALDFRTPAKAKVINVCIWVLSSFIGVPIMVMAVTKSKGKWLLGKSPSPVPSGHDRNLRRITRMVLVVVAAFIICWAPIHIFVMVWTLVDIDKKNPYVVAALHVCIALGYTNSSLNPVLYAFLDENFKRCFREFCLPFRARVGQTSFSRSRNTVREHVSTCTPSETRTNPA
ncbi:PREDICTED: delta-type opioid receptor [Chaetura pelagica]|uniref:delta-type opioid receptor n=1 Tax=Chaetura pelagica TaxID=8897 RepID=UPI000523CFA2|nr:PREDICTED: delta-type opioid receptor [Chaetura pelagica]